MRAEFKITSKNRFAAVSNATVDEVKAALYMVAEEVMTDAKMHYVPVDTGALRNSGFVEQPVMEGTKAIVALGFGGSTVAYAAAVHEAPAHHGQGKNKYLSKAVNAAVPTLANRLAAFIRTRQAAISRSGA